MITIAIAGSTHHTVLCAQSLLDAHNFEITSIITPAPKLIGRKQILTQNPLHAFANTHHIPVRLIETKINEKLKSEILNTSRPDLLLVVDFGYLVPKWCLEWPRVAPINIHPSDLPKYRGSSPGQFALLFGEKHSAVSIIVMDQELDHGPILTKIPFAVSDGWTQTEYYAHAFQLAQAKLPGILTQFIQNPTDTTPQSDESATPLARQLSRDDGYIPFPVLASLQEDREVPLTVPFLSAYAFHTNAATVFHMYQALTPWPGLWTEVVLQGQKKRMKILKLSRSNDTLTIEMIQIEGKMAQPFSEVKAIISA